jgi:hypothetical protein
MKTCEAYQDQLLEHLYGLLEADDARALTDHLASCVPCQAALARAQAQQRLLAAAAKTEFASVHFAAPTPPPERPAVLPLRATVPGVRASGWLRWAVAAAIVLAVAGLSLPAGWYYQQHDRVAVALARTRQLERDISERQQDYQTRLAAARSQRQAQVEQAARDLQAAQEQIGKLAQERQTRLVQVQQSVLNRQLHMTIVGPETYEPGAPNDYRIAIRNQAQQPAPARVTVAVLNQAKEVVYEQKDAPSQGDLQLSLPRDLPLKPGTDLSLVVRARGDNNQQGELSETLKLVAPLYLTHLTTDKPMYQPGEVVRFRSLTLERFSLKPAPDDLHLVYTLINPGGAQQNVVDGLARVANEKTGAVILGPDQKPLRGVGAGEYPIDPAAPGGEYTLRVSEAGNRFPPQERKFIVNQYEKPRLNKELEFTRKSYAPGAEVIAACKVSRVEGRMPVANRPVTAAVNVDGKTYDADGKLGGPLQLQTNAQGAVNVKFRLPPQIDKGVASLAVTFNEGAVETIVRTIPIVLKKLQVEFYPEGGDLVAGVPNRIYFQARTTLDKPAELKGRIIDPDGHVMADAVTFNVPDQPGANQGMGLFTFTPLAGKRYQLKIDEPTGIEGEYPLPEVKADGVVLTVPTGVTSAKEPIRVALRSGRVDRHLLVGVYCRGRLMAHQRVEAKQGQAAEVELQPEDGVGGVYRVTVFEEQPGNGRRVPLVPRAERLVYRVPAGQLKLIAQPDKKAYVPGDHVRLHLAAADEKGQPAPAVLMVAVTDKSVLKLADEKTFRTMPTHFLLTTEVRRPEDLEHADFLLGPHPKAAQALDLLLGTQGWRRFAEQNPDAFRNNVPRDVADRLLVAEGRLSPATLALRQTNFDAHALQKVSDEFQPRFAPLLSRLTEAQQKQAALATQADEPAPADIEELRSELASSRQEYSATVAQLSEYQALAGKVRAVALPLAAIVLLATGVVGLVIGLVRKRLGQALPYLVTATCAVMLFAALAAWQLQPSSGVAQLASGATGEVAQVDKAEPAAAPVVCAPVPPAEVEREERLAEGLGAPLNNKTGAAAPMGAKPGAGAPGPLPPGAAPRNGAFRGADKARMFNGPAAMDGKKDDDALGRGLPGRPNVKGEGRGGGGLNRADAQAEFKDGFQADRKVQVLRRQLQEVEQLKQVQKELKNELKDLAPQDAEQQFGKRALPFQAAGFGAVPAGGAMPDDGALLGNLELRKRLARVDDVYNRRSPPPALIVREYAHQHVRAEDNTRSDFAETVFWHPVLVLANGQAEASFDLPDSVTTFQVLVAGHTLDGRLGAVTTELAARLPLTLEPKLPIEVTANDKIDVPLTVANNTDSPRPVDLQVHTTGLTLLSGTSNDRLTLGPDGRTRRLYRVQPTLSEGSAELRFDGRTGALAADSIVKRLSVVPDGFPIVGAQSDMLEKVARHELVLPESWIKGTLKYQVTAYPSTLADLQKGLEALLREPCGCFEQTSTSNYPNLLILDYLKESDQAKPEVARHAQDLLARGYQKLVSFECTDSAKNQRAGYEWFGGTAPAHEALTAYGLLQFRDMARVFDVDRAMVERTKTYLMSRRDGAGGFTRNPRALDNFGRAPANVTNAYIVWALTESGKEDDVTKELAALTEQAQTSKDPYFLALVANSLLNRDRADTGLALLRKLADAQQADGHLDAAETSITGSGGRDLQIETTALGLFAWLKAQRPDRFNINIQRAVRWIGQQRGGYGGFGSTQSTILALKALIAYAKANKKAAEAGEVALYVGSDVVARQPFAAGAEEAIVLSLADPEKSLKPGKNDLRVEITGKSVFPYAATWSYQTLKPASAEHCPVGLTTALDRSTAEEGSTVRLTAKVKNESGKGQGMTVAIIGLPAGLTLPEDMKQLKDLARLRNNGTEPGPISSWETRGRELILYWRDLAPTKQMEVNIDLICRVPGEYRGPASRAYLYYNADHKCWVQPLDMKITPKN